MSSVVRVEPVPDVYAGSVLSAGHRWRCLMYAVGLISILLGGLGFLVSAVVVLVRGTSIGPVSSSVLATLCVILGIACLPTFVKVGIAVQLHGNRVLYRAACRSQRVRPGLLVDPDDPDAIFVEVVPRQHWAKSNWKLETAADVGFLRIDHVRGALLFEGDRERYTIPAEAILDCEVERVEPPSRFAGQTDHYPHFMAVVRAKGQDGVWEAPIAPRYDARRLFVGTSFQARARELQGRILSILPSAQGHDSEPVALAPAPQTSAPEPFVQHADVLAELHRIQNKKSGWLGGLLVLALSLAVFVGSVGAGWRWRSMFVLVPVLFLHELGHLVAMRLFNYRNTRMFFIPFFGAAAAGQNYNVPGWKKAVVSLAGPVPGILVGIVLGVVGLILGQSWLIRAALLAVILNAFNLIPVLPLDGGWVLHATLFCRHRYMDVAFRILAVVALAGLGLLTRDRILPYVAIPMLISLPVAYRAARIADKLRGSAIALPAPDQQDIPPVLADTIIEEVRSSFPRRLSTANIARMTLSIFETLNARPPGWAATVGLLTLHGASVLMAIVFSVLFVLGQRGDLLGTLQLAATRPRTPYVQGSTLVWEGDAVARDSADARHTLVADFSGRADAETVFRQLPSRLPQTARMTLFGQTLLVSLPSEDEATRNSLFDELQQRTQKIAVNHAGNRVIFWLFCISPDDATGQEIEQELQHYFTVGARAPLIPPWSPLWHEATDQVEQWRKARRTFHRIEHEPPNVYQSPELKDLYERSGRAALRGNQAEQARLLQEQQALMRQLKLKYLESLQSEGAELVDVELIDLYVEQMQTLETRFPLNLPPALTDRFGLLPAESQLPVDPEGRPIAVSGYVARRGSYLSLASLTLPRIDQDLPAIADWLYSKGCIKLTYECLLGTMPDTDSGDFD
ncbi:MAG: site-2 protease family protein [Planctomycetes bacterium]|nr:site-2 protease family protein [Planctomycetota bacterium]